jgi:hypothetical protein
MANLHLVLYVAAFVLFACASLGVPSPRVNLMAAGLACFMLTFIV